MVNSRKISLIVLLAVSLVMFIQAILPHHHHEEEVCFADSQCTESCMVSEPEGDRDHCHDQDDPGREESCTLNSMYLLPDVKGAGGKADADGMIRNVQMGLLLPEEDHAGILQQFRLSDRFSPVSICRQLAGKSISLRAPPVIS